MKSGSIARHAAPFVVLCIVVCACGAARGQLTVEDILAKQPAQDQRQAAELNEAFLALGPEAIVGTCGLLVAPGTGDDAQARFALDGLAKYASRAGADAQRALVERVLLEAAPAAADNDVKAFLLSLLRWVGGDASVEPLSTFLGDELLCDPAARALTTIGTPGAAAKLLEALPAVQGLNRIAVINALGTLRCVPAADHLLEAARDADPAVRDAAFWALANTGVPRPDCVEVFGSRLQALDGIDGAAADTERSKLLSYFFLYAQRIEEAGGFDLCGEIYRQIVAGAGQKFPPHVQCRALASLLTIRGKDALDDLLAAMDNPSMEVRAVALRGTLALPGRIVTKKWVNRSSEVSPDVRREILAMLVERDDSIAWGALLKALDDGEAATRLLAIGAMSRFDSAKALDALVGVLRRTDDKAEIEAVKAALQRSPVKGLAATLAKALPDVPAAGRVAMLQVLADRRASAQRDAVFAQTAGGDAEVRLAAIRAFRYVGEKQDIPRLIALLLGVESDDERRAAHDTLVAVARGITPSTQQATGIVAALAKTAPEKRERLLRVLVDLGGRKALDAVVAETRSDNAVVRATAVDSLADWKDVSATTPLLDVYAVGDDPVVRKRVLDAYLRLASGDGIEEEDRVWLYGEALTACASTEEKQRVLDALGGVHSLDVVRLVRDWLGDAAVGKAAAAAAVGVICPEDAGGVAGYEAVETLKTVAGGLEDENLKKRAEDYLANIPLPDELDLALGKPVTTSVKHQGDHVPEQAVDGKTNRESAWHGESLPASLQVDLGALVSIEKVHVYFHWDGERYYQYTVDVSADGEQWQSVADRSASTEPATARGVMHTFAPVQARYVRVNAFKNSANPAAHLVELKVYAEGAALTPPPAFEVDAPGFVPLFNGRDLTGWKGDKRNYVAEFGKIVCLPAGHMNLYTQEDFSDFALRFEFKLSPGTNNGVGIRTPFMGHAAYDGMEIQILDDSAEQYKDLKPYQFHGSIYGLVPAERGHLNPVGQWNSQEIIAQGRHITVNLNGATIVDTDLDSYVENGTPDEKDHPGLKVGTGRIGFLGHGSRVEFRNIRIKKLE